MSQGKSNKHFTFPINICSLRYPACSAHAPYCHLWPARLYKIFPHYLKRSHDFRKENVIEQSMYILKFSITFVSNISNSKKNWARNDKKCVRFFKQSTSYSFTILKKPGFSKHIFGKYTNIKFNENPFIGRRVVPCRQTDRQDEANIRFSQICERAWNLVCYFRSSVRIRDQLFDIVTSWISSGSPAEWPEVMRNPNGFIAV